MNGDYRTVDEMLTDNDAAALRKACRFQFMEGFEACKIELRAVIHDLEDQLEATKTSLAWHRFELKSLEDQRRDLVKTKVEHMRELKELRTKYNALSTATQCLVSLCETYQGHPIHNDVRVTGLRALLNLP